MDYIEYRGKLSKGKKGEDLPFPIMYCVRCGKYYHMFFRAPYYVLLSGIEEFMAMHVHCKVEDIPS